VVKVPLYQENQDRVALRPEYSETLVGGATADAFGSAIGKGLQSVASGMDTAAEAVQRVQEMRDDAVVSDAANQWLQEKDKLLYDADTGYANAEGRQAVEGFDAYRKSVEGLKGNIAAKMSPAQKDRFDRHVAPYETDALRSGVIKKSAETKKWLLQEHTAAADNFLRQAIQTPDDEARWSGFIGRGLQELDARGAKEGWGKERAELERTTYISNARLQSALRIGESDAVKAAKYATDHGADITPQDHMVLLDRLKPDLKRAAAADAAHFNASNPAPGQFAARGLSHDDYALLSVISGTESPAYDRMNGGQRISDYAAHPGFIGAGGTTTATGRYQIVRDTWNRAATALGLTDFSPASQDRAAAWIAQADYRRNAGRDLARDIADGNYASIRRNLETTWEGLQKISDEEFARRLAAARSAPLAASAAAGAAPAAAGPSAAPVAPAASATTSGREAVEPQPAGPQFSPGVESVLSALPPAYADEIRESAAEGMRAAAMQQTVREKAMQVAQAEAYRRRIDNDDPSLTARDIRDDTVIDTGDKATLVGALDEKKKEAFETSLNVAAFRNGTLAIDPFTDEGRKANDNLWAAMSAHVADPSQIEPLLLNQIRRTSTVPTQVGNDLRLDLSSGNVRRMVGALERAGRIAAISPGAIGRMTGGAEIADDVARYSHYVNDVGLPPGIAAQRIIDRKDPDKARQRDALMETSRMKYTIRRLSTEANVRAIYDKGLFSFAPSLGSNPRQAAAFASDYRDILTESIFDQGGDVDAGVSLANDRFRRKFGMSQFMEEGPDAVTYLPPEKTYPAHGDGSHTYIRDQLNAFLAKDGIVHGVVFLQSDADTENDVAIGRAPRYQVYYRDENGVLTHHPHPFSAIPPTSEEIEAARIAASDKKMAEFEAEQLKARQEREQDELFSRVVVHTLMDPMWPLRKAAPSSSDPAPSSTEPSPPLDSRARPSPNLVRKK
jgi:muramidase (phage lysozyme)